MTEPRMRAAAGMEAAAAASGAARRSADIAQSRSIREGFTHSEAAATTLRATVAGTHLAAVDAALVVADIALAVVGTALVVVGTALVVDTAAGATS